LFSGAPLDIEWCIAQGTIYVVQARPITSLFPVPCSESKGPGLRIFLSFGHLQMMLDAMPWLALEVWRYFMPAGKDEAPNLRARLVQRLAGGANPPLRGGDECILLSSPPPPVVPHRRGHLLWVAQAPGRWSLGPGGTRGCRCAVAGVAWECHHRDGPRGGRPDRPPAPASRAGDVHRVASVGRHPGGAPPEGGWARARRRPRKVPVALRQPRCGR